MRRLLLFLFCSVMMACGSVPTDEKIYFDLEGFFEKEIRSLSELKPYVSKSISFNNKLQSKTTNEISWEKELRFFKESDINKPAWKYGYRTDTIEDPVKNTIRISYTATDWQLLTRKVIIEQDRSGKVLFVEIRNITSNNLYVSYQVLKYRPGLEYFILAFQSVKLMDNSTMIVHSRFLKQLS